MIDYTNSSIALNLVLTRPEDVLIDLGTKGTVDLLRGLSKDPEAASQIQTSKIVELIEGGIKYFVGKIMLEDKNDE